MSTHAGMADSSSFRISTSVSLKQPQLAIFAPVTASSVIRMRAVTSNVRLVQPDEAKVRGAPRDEQANATRDYLAESIQGHGVRYFSIVADDDLVGEIFLHDIGAERPDSALVGYALFEPRFRGRGFGST